MHPIISNFCFLIKCAEWQKNTSRRSWSIWCVNQSSWWDGDYTSTIFDNLLIPSIENWFSDTEVIFRTIMYLEIEQRRLNMIFRKGIQNQIWPANSPDLNTIENLWWKIFKMVYEKALSPPKVLLTAFQES